MPFADIRGSEFNYRIAGSGDPVTLVHGVGSDLESWNGVADRLTPHFQGPALRPARAWRDREAARPLHPR